MATNFKLGKLPARKNSISFRFRDYHGLAKLPAAPVSAGHYKAVPDWQGMLGNDQYGDCVLAGGDHEHIDWTTEGATIASFTPATALSDYSAITGFKKSDPNTDQGTDMQKAASYRRKTGLLDAHGKRHKILAYLALTPGNREEVKQAVSLFGAVGIGIEFPESAMTQFNDNKPWTVVSGSAIDGGHYVPAVGYDHLYLYVVTWPSQQHEIQKMSWAFFDKYMDEGIAYISPEILKAGKSPEGFNLTQLQADLSELK